MEKETQRLAWWNVHLNGNRLVLRACAPDEESAMLQVKHFVHDEQTQRLFAEYIDDEMDVGRIKQVEGYHADLLRQIGEAVTRTVIVSCSKQ